MEVKEQLTLENLQAKLLIEKNQIIGSLMAEVFSMQERIKKIESNSKPQPAQD